MRRVVVSFSAESGKELRRFEAQFNETPAATAVWNVLPIAYRLCFWGQSLWIELPLPGEVQVSGATWEVGEGDIAYWPPGKQVHIYLGRTPESTGDTPTPPSPVVLIGSLVSPAAALRDFLKAVPRRFTYVSIDGA